MSSLNCKKRKIYLHSTTSSPFNQSNSTSIYSSSIPINYSSNQSYKIKLWLSSFFWSHLRTKKCLIFNILGIRLCMFNIILINWIVFSRIYIAKMALFYVLFLVGLGSIWEVKNGLRKGIWIPVLEDVKRLFFGWIYVKYWFFRFKPRPMKTLFQILLIKFTLRPPDLSASL